MSDFLSSAIKGSVILDHLFAKKWAYICVKLDLSIFPQIDKSNSALQVLSALISVAVLSIRCVFVLKICTNTISTYYKATKELAQSVQQL